ncbi:hypothetical protein F442_10100 [Phytophthora nicotianae P10297]|uniref:Crinkler effector protein N-terminal domain-containing protein n=1 Tax=Phytophthora nicotianae P10297 TaxID=1317064 RepID=W2Z6X9_PHYNI|nr:hypothetical protein F442_10100 [Phytophthora nicotianae P10297]
MVNLFCALVGVKGNAFPVTIDASESKGDDNWLDRSGAEAVTLDEHGHPEGFTHMDPLLWIKNPKNFGDSFEPNEGEIHVLVMVPEVDQEQWDEQRARKKARSLTVIEVERMNSIAATLDIDMWQIGGIALDIRHVEPDFPAWFYVRKEKQGIIKIFNDRMEKQLSTVFVGTPGVGESMMVVLFAFFMTLRQQKRVVLFRKLKKEGFSMLYLDAKGKQYRRENVLEVKKVDHLLGIADELCLDGFTHDDVKANFGRLARFRLLATSVQYPKKNDDGPVLRRCLVPFWSKLGLKSVGAHFIWTEHNINYYLDGNLSDFLSEKSVVIDSIDQAIGLVDAQVTELLNTQYVLDSEKQIDRLRMTSVQASEQDLKNRSSSAKYTMTRSSFCVIASENALRQLGKIVAPSYYEELWSKGRMLGDDGLMGIAFENYVHAMARDG